MVATHQCRPDAGQALQHPDQRRRHGEHRPAPTSRAQRRTRAPAATDRNPRSLPRMALRPIGKIRLAALDREIQARAGTILPTFCPTAPHRAARTRITLNDQSAYPPADQGERASGEPCRTDTDESHPTEYRKVGGSIPSLPTRFVQLSGLAAGTPRWTILNIAASLRHVP